MIMTILLLTVVSLVVCFGFVLLFGAPYLPTLKPQILTGLELLDLGPGDTLLELGCGDGRVLIAAAQQGIHVVGYELNPLLAAMSWLRTRRYRPLVRVVWGNYWQSDWPPAQGIYGFILAKYMERLDTKIIQYAAKPVRLVSFAFAIPGRKPAAARDGLFRYDYK